MIVLIVSILLILYEISNSEPTMTLEEFHERFDNEEILKHFKEKYTEHFAGMGKSFGMIMPTWGI